MIGNPNKLALVLDLGRVSQNRSSMKLQQKIRLQSDVENAVMQKFYNFMGKFRKGIRNIKNLTASWITMKNSV